MRRMISFAPVAHGTINVAENRFELDNKLEEGFYLINIKEPSYEQSCSCFLKVTNMSYNNSTVFLPAEDLDGQSTILSYFLQEPTYLHIGIAELFPAGSTIEVVRIA